MLRNKKARYKILTDDVIFWCCWLNDKMSEADAMDLEFDSSRCCQTQKCMWTLTSLLNKKCAVRFHEKNWRFCTKTLVAKIAHESCASAAFLFHSLNVKKSKSVFESSCHLSITHWEASHCPCNCLTSGREAVNANFYSLWHESESTFAIAAHYLLDQQELLQETSAFDRGLWDHTGIVELFYIGSLVQYPLGAGMWQRQ